MHRIKRRSLLLAGAGIVLARATQAQPAPRRIPLIAQTIAAKLEAGATGTSTLFRLVEPVPILDGTLPPIPVLRMREGEAAVLQVENRLPQPLMLHLRGLRQPAQDGVAGLTGDAVPPGKTLELALPGLQAGSFILTPLIPALAPEQVARGLVAILIVEERLPPPVDHDIALAISDWRVDGAGVLAADFASRLDVARLGRLGNRLIANGRPAPDRLEIRPGARIRLRLVNVSNARVFPLKVSNMQAAVIAIDSTPCSPFDPLKRTVILSPGTRIEMILDAPEKPGEEALVEAKIGEGLPLFAFRTAGSPLPAKGRAEALPDPGLPPAIKLQAATRAEITITGGIGREAPGPDSAALMALFPDAGKVFAINGAAGRFTGKPVASVTRGGVLVLALANKTAWPQVIGIHGHAFRLLHPFDDGWEPYFLDTLYLTPGTTARIALIADQPGKWAIRSTIAEHLAGGVFTWFEVKAAEAPKAKAKI